MKTPRPLASLPKTIMAPLLALSLSVGAKAGEVTAGNQGGEVGKPAAALFAKPFAHQETTISHLSPEFQERTRNFKKNIERLFAFCEEHSRAGNDTLTLGEHELHFIHMDDPHDGSKKLAQVFVVLPGEKDSSIGVLESGVIFNGMLTFPDEDTVRYMSDANYTEELVDDIENLLSGALAAMETKE